MQNYAEAAAGLQRALMRHR